MYICNLSTWRRRQGHQEFQVNLGYILSLRIAWAIRDLSTTKQTKAGRQAGRKVGRKEGREEGRKEGRTERSKEGGRKGGRENGFKAIVSIYRELNQSIKSLLKQPSQFLKCSAYNIKKNEIIQRLDISTEGRRRPT